MLLDSNILIYSLLPEYTALRQWCFHQQVCVSSITQLDVLGYHQLNETDKSDLSHLFELTIIYPIDGVIINRAISLRQQKKMSVGDAIIAATALEYTQTLVTRNKKDFEWINGLKVIDPLEDINDD